MHKTLARLAVAGVSAAALAVPATALFSTTAHAATGSTSDTTSPASTTSRFDTAKARCVAAIDRRVADLAAMQSRVTASTALTGEHKTALSNVLSSATSGLQALRPQVQAVADKAALQPLCTSVVRDYRVYVLRKPQVNVAIALDTESARQAALQSRATTLQQLIAKAQQQGKDVTKANADLARMQQALQQASATLAGQADKLLALTPADYNANNGVVAPYRSVAVSARGQLQSARSAAADVVRDLRALRTAG